MRRAAVASLTVVVSLVAAASAFAAPTIPHSLRHVQIPASVFLRADADAGGGYKLGLTAFHLDVPPQNGEPARVSSYLSLMLTKIGASAEYVARKRHFDVAGSVAAEWAARGRVNAHFVARQVDHEPVPRCDGDYTVETGLLVGMLRFRGEGGYAEVDSTAVPATLTRQPEMECDFSSLAKGDESHESSSVGGSFGRSRRQLGVSASEHPALGTLTVRAYSSTSRDGVYVTRRVSATAPLTALALHPEAETATLTAPPPFTGSATYRAFPGKEAGTWRGDLTVDFPGEPGVRLAGKRFGGAKLKPGECAPDDGSICSSLKALSPVGLKPEQPLGAARARLFLISE